MGTRPFPGIFGPFLGLFGMFQAGMNDRDISEIFMRFPVAFKGCFKGSQKDSTSFQGYFKEVLVGFEKF